MIRMVKKVKHIKPGYNLTEVGVIPMDWGIESLWDIWKWLIWLTYKPKNVKNFWTLVLRSSNIQNEKLTFKDNVYVDLEIPSEILTKEDDILVCARNWSRDLIWKSVILPKKYEWLTFWAFMCVYRSPYWKYISHVFRSSIIKKQINQYLWATINQITNSSLNSFIIPLPTGPEQSKIAQVLSDTDLLIASLDELIEKKKAIKQGAMQNLLTGKMRLPGFSGDWENTLLGKICEIKKWQLITSSLKQIWNVPVIAWWKTPAYFHSESNRQGKTITISASWANAWYISFYTIPIFASDCSTISESKDYSIEFIYYYLLLNQNNIYHLQTWWAQPHIHAKDLNPIQIWVPKLNEQVRIAQVLSDMDTEISELEKKRDKYKQIKYGMMSELLTGNIRLLWVK